MLSPDVNGPFRVVDWVRAVGRWPEQVTAPPGSVTVLNGRADAVCVCPSRNVAERVQRLLELGLAAEAEARLAALEVD